MAGRWVDQMALITVANSVSTRAAYLAAPWAASVDQWADMTACKMAAQLAA